VPDPNQQTDTAQFRSLLCPFAFDPGLIADHLLGEEHLARVIAQEIPRTCARIFTPLITLATFLAQILSDDHSCQAALDRLLAWRAARGLPPTSPDTGGYCKARQRLPETILPRLVREVADRIGDQVPETWLWHGRRVILVDGSAVSMPDTPENQAAYPQPSIQKAGCGFPVARVVVLIALATGVVLDAAIGRCSGKLTGESTLLRGLHDRLKRDDIVLADRYYCSYFEIALLKAQGVDLVTRQNVGRTVDFRRGRRLGKDDHLVEWSRPQRASWMDKEIYATIPEALTVRELRVRVGRRGFRTRVLIVVTTLLEAGSFSHTDLAGLYRSRWHVELDLRSIKLTLKMDVLRCKSPEMIRKELWGHLLISNLIRGVMAEAARRYGVVPRRLSFQGARQMLDGFRVELNGTSSGALQGLIEVMLRMISRLGVGGRPDRYEPRVRKRRAKAYPLMHTPRKEWKKLMAKVG
jgi:hypothetical protein